MSPESDCIPSRGSMAMSSESDCIPSRGSSQVYLNVSSLREETGGLQEGLDTLILFYILCI